MGIAGHSALEKRFRAVYGSLVPNRITPAALSRKLDAMFDLDGPSLERELRKLVTQGRPRPRLTWYIGWALQDYFNWLNGPVLLWYTGHLGSLAQLHIGLARIGATIDVGRAGTRALTQSPVDFPNRSSRALFLDQEHLMGTHDTVFATRSAQGTPDEEGLTPVLGFAPSRLLHWERAWDAWVAKPAVNLSEDLDLRVALEMSSLTSTLTFAERESEIAKRLDRAASRRISSPPKAPWEAMAMPFWRMLAVQEPQEGDPDGRPH